MNDNIVILFTFLINFFFFFNYSSDAKLPTTQMCFTRFQRFGDVVGVPPVRRAFEPFVRFPSERRHITVNFIPEIYARQQIIISVSVNCAICVSRKFKSVHLINLTNQPRSSRGNTQRQNNIVNRHVLDTKDSEQHSKCARLQTNNM